MTPISTESSASGWQRLAVVDLGRWQRKLSNMHTVPQDLTRALQVGPYGPALGTECRVIARHWPDLGH